MTEPAQVTASPGKRRTAYIVTVIVTAAVTFGLAALLMNINDRKNEAEHHYFPRVQLDEDTIDAATWGKNFPSQYQDYLKTVDVQQTKHGGSEAFSKLEQDPRLVRMYKGYAFSVDFREERGHAYMLSDQDITDRTTKFKQPGACLHCHASNLLAFKKL